jgi:hypothetical protein
MNGSSELQNGSQTSISIDFVQHCFYYNNIIPYFVLNIAYNFKKKRRTSSSRRKERRREEKRDKNFYNNPR